MQSIYTYTDKYMISLYLLSDRISLLIPLKYRRSERTSFASPLSNILEDQSVIIKRNLSIVTSEKVDKEVDTDSATKLIKSLQIKVRPSFVKQNFNGCQPRKKRTHKHSSLRTK